MYSSNIVITVILIVGVAGQVAWSQCPSCNYNTAMVRPFNGRILLARYPDGQEVAPARSCDACSCSNQMVIPAVKSSCPSVSCSGCCQPPPVTYCQCPPSASSPVDCQGPPYTPDPPGLYIPEYLSDQGPPPNPCYSACAPAPPSVPVDPVSLALAYSKAQKGLSIREEKLNFGALKKPVESEVVETESDVPEDGLYALKNQIVELRPNCRRTACPAEEAALSFFEEEEDCACDCDDEGPSYPTYRDLGYVPECPACSTFQPGAPLPSSCRCQCQCQCSDNKAGKLYNKGTVGTLFRRTNPKSGNCGCSY